MAIGEVITNFKPIEEGQITIDFQPILVGEPFYPQRATPIEPPPFKIDEFVNDWQKTRSMDEDPPQDDVANIFDNFTRPFQKFYYSFGSSLNRGLGHFATNLNTIFEYSEEKRVKAGGKPIPTEKRGYLFKTMADSYEENADYWQRLASQSPPDFLNEFLGKFTGSLLPGMAEFALSLKSFLVYPFILELQESKKRGLEGLGQTVAATLKAAEVGLLGLIFKVLGPFNLYTKAPILGTTFGVEDAAKQLVTKGEVDPDQVIEAMATGFGLGLTPGGRMEFKDIAKNMRSEITKIETKLESLKPKVEIKEEIKPTEIILTPEEERIFESIRAKKVEEVVGKEEQRIISQEWARKEMEEAAKRPEEVMPILGKKLSEIQPEAKVGGVKIDFVEDANTKMFVAYDGTKEVGWYQVTPKEGGFIGETISVHPDYKRQGIATELINRAEEKFGERLGGTPPTEAGKAFLEKVTKEHKPEAKVEGVKQPWEMTKREYAPTPERKGLQPLSYSRGYDAWRLKIEEHKNSVQQAFSEGKPVPPEVLADYPELIKPEPKVEGIAGLEELRIAQREKEQAGKVQIGLATPIPKFEFSDPIIEKSFQESIPKKEPFISKVGEFFTDVWHKMTRPYEYLPRTKEFAQLQFDLKKLEKQKGVASYNAILDVAKVLSEVKGEDYNLFTRKVILDDLKGEAERGHDLPWGFDKDSIKVELDRINNEITNNKFIQDALGKRKVMWDTIKDEYSTAMEDIGFDVSERFKNEDYFRHQVLEYINLNGLYGTGKRLKTPSTRGFLRAREGSQLDINRDFIQPEYEVVSQMLYDIQVAKTIKNIDEKYNISDQVKKDAKQKGLTDWHEAIPKGYMTWQPRQGNIFYMADSIPAKLAEKLHSRALAELGVKESDLRDVLSIGRKRKEFVVKEEIANTLDELVKTKTQSMIGNADREIIKGWKVWQLISPRRFFKYNLRNLTGDADAVFVGNPRGFLKTPQSIKDLVDVFFNKKEITGDLKDFFDRGGFSATLQAQEMGELRDLWVFERLYRDQNPSIKEVPYRIWKKYWKTVRINTDIRETILRYGNYLDYLEQMKSDPNGNPKNFGASKPEEIMGLADIKDRAYWLSNDLLGAYDRISVMGQSLREYAFPFWSWKELNFKRYAQFARNAANDGQLASTVGRKALGTIAHTPYMAYKVGKFLISATALWSTLQVWNHTMFPEEEDDLSEDEQSQPHIVLGRDRDGNIINFNRIGALGDFLEWFGLDNAPKYVDNWFKGEMTLKEIAIDMTQSPINLVGQGITPQIKISAELVTQRALFPDIFKPTTIRDRGLYLARSLALENEYKAIMGLPSRGYSESLRTFLVYSSDPGQGSYQDIQETKQRWLKEQGKGAEGFWITPKGNALYNMKLALRYEDNEAFNKYSFEYLMLGGTAKGIEESLDRMHPLSGLSKKDRSLFEQSLSSDQIKRLGKAIEFYQTTLIGGSK